MLAFLPGGIGMTEMLVVGVVAVLLFGSRLPSVARSLGKSMTEFRRGMQDLQTEFNSAMHEAETAATTPATGTQARLPADVAHDDSMSDEAYDRYDPSEDPAAETDEPADPTDADRRETVE